MAISPLLQEYLDRHNVTQTALARKTGMNQANISLIFTRRRRARLDTLERLAAGIGIEVSTLIRLMKNGETE